MKNFNLLGTISPQKFFCDYWQKKPLLIRNAIPNFKPLLSQDELFALAKDNEVEARLISQQDGQWNIGYSPLKRLPSPRKPNWTLLLQSVNLHHKGAAALLEQFRFLPDARLDDLMISYATDAGGVGPHFDSYDVFLLQAHGQRRWRISSQTNLDLVEGLPLKILKHFEVEEEWVLEPGDMLYLPPHYAHDGIAQGECMTYSIGFRAPAYQELAEGFLEFLIDTVEIEGRYTDPELRATKRPAEIPSAMQDKITEAIRRIRFDDDDISIFLGEYLTEPKRNVVFNVPTASYSAKQFEARSLKKGVKMTIQSRLMYRGKNVFINGESFSVNGRDLALLKTLGDERRLAPDDIAAASASLKDALYTWFSYGWIAFN